MPRVVYRSDIGAGTSRSATVALREAISNLPSEIVRDALDRAFPLARVMADLDRAQRLMPPSSVVQEAMAAAEQAQRLLADFVVR